MGRLIAIDPGVQALGWATFERGKLARCGLLQAATAIGMAETVRDEWGRTKGVGMQLIIEKPQVYRQRHWKGDPNDLIDVAMVVGAAVVAFPGAERRVITPHTWKGNRPKAVCNAHTLRLLSVPERHIVNQCHIRKSLMHNVLDAIGIGLWALDRR